MVVLGENIHQWELSDGNVIGVTRLEIKDLMTSFSEFSEPILQIGSKSSILVNVEVSGEICIEKKLLSV